MMNRALHHRLLQRLHKNYFDFDIAEKNDLSQINKSKVKSLYSELQDWWKITNAPIPTEQNPEYIPTVNEESWKISLH